MASPGRGSRTKGGVGEREFLKKLSEELQLETPLQRNLQQSRSGGADCIELGAFAIEIKRQERLEIKKWWEQAVRQAVELDRVPVLAYRQNGKKWSIVLPLSWLAKDARFDWEDTAQVSLPVFAKLIKGHGDT